MKSLIKSFSLLLLSGSLIFGVSSCQKDDTNTNNNPNPTSKNTIKDELQNNEKYSTMDKAVEESNNDALFADANANITLFVADNDAWNDFFAKMNVSSITELKSKMGDDQFSRLVLYQALNGKFTTSSMNNGYFESEAKNENDAKLDVHVQSKGNGNLVINDENDGSVTNASETEFSNGTIIGVDAVVQFQTNYDNVQQMNDDDNNQDHIFVDLVTNANSNIEGQLQDQNESSTIFYANDAQAKALLDLNLKSIFDEDDFNELFDANQQTNIFAQVGVSTFAELMNSTSLSLQTMLSITGKTMTDFMNVLDEADKTEYAQSIMLNSNIDAQAMADQGSVTTESGVTYNVITNSDGDLKLTDQAGNTIILSNDDVQSINGSLYTVVSVTKS